MLPQTTTPITPQRPTRDQVRHARHVVTSPDYWGREGAILWAWAVLRADHKARTGTRTAITPPDGNAA